MSSVKAGEAYIELGVRDKLDAGLKAASAKMNAVGKKFATTGAAITGVGAAITGSMVGIASSFANAGDKLQKMSLRTGASVESLSAIAFAAEQSGTSIDAVGDAMFRASRRIANAAETGMGPAARALKMLGVNTQELNAMSADQQFLKLADVLSKVENEALANQMGFEIFGNSFKQLKPLLDEGSDGIKALMEEAGELGRTMSTDDANAAAAYADAMNRVKSATTGAKNQIGAALAPAITEITNAFVAILKPVIQFVKNNREMILGVAALGAALLAAGAALTTAGFAFMGIGAALGAVASAIAFVVSPIGIAIAAFAALGIAVYKYTEFGGEAVDWFLGKIEPIAEVISNTFSRVQNALATGDLNAVFDAVAEGLEFTWLSVVDSLIGTWDMFTGWFYNISAEVVKAVGGLFEQLGDLLRKSLQAYGSYYNKVFNFVTETIGEMGGVKTIGGPVDAFDGGAAIGINVDEIGNTVTEFGSALKDSAKGIKQSSAADRAARDEERRRRMEELKKSITEGGAAADAAMEERRKKRKTPDMPDLEGLLEGFQGQATEAQKEMKHASRGTFSSIGALFMGGQDSIQKDQLKVQQRIADNTEEMVDNAGGASFQA